MRSLILSITIMGLLFVSAAPALAEEGVQSHNAATITYLSNATDQATIIPVVRYYGYYGPRAGYYYYRPYRPYYVRPYPYRNYVVPGPVYGYSYYPPDDYYYYYGSRRSYWYGY
jgi:hypothetical protein